MHQLYSLLRKAEGMWKSFDNLQFPPESSNQVAVIQTTGIYKNQEQHDEEILKSIENI